MIIVTGATGKLGRAVILDLLTRMDPAQIGATAREPAKAADLAAQGVDIRQGDFADPAGLEAAFRGASQVLIVSADAEARGGDAVALHRNAIDAAKAAGVRRVLYTSHMAASAGSKFIPAHTHAATEALLRESGLAYTALRNGFYASSALPMMGDFAASGAITAPADAKTSWTSHADLAAAAAVILAEEGRYDGATPALTAQQALNFDDIAAIASDLLGRPVTRNVVADDAFFTRAVEFGMPQPVAAIARSFYAASRNGEFAAIDPTLPRLIGRPTQTMRQVMAEALGLTA